jgi:hypothetical protein
MEPQPVISRINDHKQFVCHYTDTHLSVFSLVLVFNSHNKQQVGKCVWQQRLCLWVFTLPVPPVLVYRDTQVHRLSYTNLVSSSSSLHQHLLPSSPPRLIREKSHYTIKFYHWFQTPDNSFPIYDQKPRSEGSTWLGVKSRSRDTPVRDSKNFQIWFTWPGVKCISRWTQKSNPVWDSIYDQRDSWFLESIVKIVEWDFSLIIDLDCTNCVFYCHSKNPRILYCCGQS